MIALFGTPWDSIIYMSFRFIVFLYFIGFLAFPCFGLAQESEKYLDGTFKLQSTAYTTPIESQPELNNTYNSSLNLKGGWRGRFGEAKAETLLGHYSEINNSYIVLPEFFVATEFLDPHSKITLGREFQNWSLLDQQWKFAQWEPRFNIDALQPIRQGLTGLRWNFTTDQFNFGVFYSSFFMPNMGAQVIASNGNLDARNRWIANPKSNFPLQGKSTQILYSLDTPSIAKIINQQSYLLYSKFGSDNLGPWVSMSWGKKPVNELVLGYKGLLRIVDDGTFGDVTILPKVATHEITSLDAGYRWNQSSFLISNLKDLPQNLLVPQGWNMQQLEKMDAWSARWDLKLLDIAHVDGEIGLSRLIVNGGHIYELDSENNYGATIDGMRVPFTNAWAIDFKGALIGFKKSLVSSELRFVHDIIQEGEMMNAEVQLHPNSVLNLLVGADVIGVSNSSANNTAKTFLNQYRANDRVYAGAAYVF